MKIFRNSIFTVLVILSSFISLQAQDVVISNISTTSVSCGGGSDGTIAVTITGGIGLYTYLLVRNGFPVENAGPIAASNYTFTGHDKYGSYIIIVSDQSGSTGDGIAVTAIDGPEPIAITSFFTTDISCNSVNDGTISVTATGEAGNFVFDLTGPEIWSNETGIFPSLSQGDYTVLVRDKDGCPSTDVTPVLTINNPSAISIAVNSIIDVLCYDENTGSIAITPSGGIPSGIGSGYTYDWTGPGGFSSTSEDITNLKAGDYFVTVADGNMCSSNMGPITINQAPDLTVTLNSTTDVTCNGGNDGVARITAGGGVGAYSYSWDGQNSGLNTTVEDPIILVSDTYDLTISDGNGCSKTFVSFVTIDEPAPFNIVLDATTGVTCSGWTNGTASITATGGTPLYTFAWTGATSGYSSTDEDPVGMPADVYSLTITDSRGCNQDFPNLLTITEPLPLVLVLNGSTNVSCFSGNDGTASTTLTGGTLPYAFSWTGDGTGHVSAMEDPIDLIADTYDLIVTDGNSCTLPFNNLINISEPADLAVVVDNITDVNCNGEATGAIVINPAGGTPLYNFSWSGPNSFTAGTQDISNLEAGNYSLTLTDTKGCSKDFNDVATIVENILITATFSLTHVTCNGGSNGRINSNISGGKPNFSYSWTGPFGFTSFAKNISGLVSGDYQLTVTDALGCLKIMPVQTLNEPPPIAVTTTQVNIDCFGADNGSIDLTPAGGTPPYTAAWTGPGGFTASTEDLSGLLPGAYSVTITDANLCSKLFNDIVTILEPSIIQVSSVKSDISCGGLTDGAIDITVTGGTLSYLHTWTGPSAFTSSLADIADLEAGSYSLSITDGNGCEVPFPNIETIIEPPPIIATYVSHLDVLCNGDASGSVQIDVSGGTGLLTFIWTNSAGITQSTDEDPTGLPAETYSLTVTDINGCNIPYSDMVIITEPPALSSILTGMNISCFGYGDGTITVLASGGSGPYEYSILGDLDAAYQASNVFPALGPGLQTVWTRDNNRCVVIETITIQEPGEMEILSESHTDNLCYGDSAAQISIDAVSGGVIPYEYSINGGIDYSSSDTFTNLPAGSYQTVVRDASGCPVLGDLNVVGQPPQLKINSFNQVNVTSCYDALEGQISIKGLGGTGIITYTLNGTIFNLTGDFQNLPGGPYTVTMEDGNACIMDTSVVITAPPAIIVNFLAITDITECNGDATGSATVAGSGGTGSINYSLDGGPYQAGGTFGGLLAGNHTISLRDNQACTRDTAFSIVEPGPINIISENITDISCAGSNNGIIEIIASGGNVPLTYTLTPGLITNASGVFPGLAPGIYTVAVDDPTLCGPVISSPLEIIDPPVFLLDSISDKNISCNGVGNGSISIYVSGGVPPYEYSVDNQGSWSLESVFTGLTPASYEVYIRDANLCLIIGGSFVMADPPQISVSVTTTDITTCSGDTTGVIDVVGSGGTGILAYSLDGIAFQSSGTFSMLPADTYNVYTRDEAGCVHNETVSILEPAPVMATITKTDATYGNLGSITISGSTGGNPPYLYSIEGDTGTFTGDTAYIDLEAATYHVVIMDINTCTYQEIVEVLDVPPLDVVVDSSNISCFGQNDGSIGFIPQDAEGSVEYSIDSGMNFVSTALFEDLPGNITYYLVARDSMGKVFTGEVTLTEPSEIILTRIITPAECNAFSETGAINITVSGGSGPYSYFWTDGITEEDRSNIVAGPYILETRDNDNCTRTDLIEVNSFVIVDAYAGEDTTICYGESIRLNALGGHIPSWDPSPFIPDTSAANQLTYGITQTSTFVLTITEETSPYACFNMDSLFVMLYPLTGLEATEDSFIISGSSAQLEAKGGPFTEYRWEPTTGLDNSTIADPMATPFESIRYYVYGTNDYGCEEVDSVFIEVIENIQVYNVFSPNGDGINDYFEIENSERFPDMLVEVYSRWGDQFFSNVGYDDGSRWDGTARGKDAPVGTYYYIIIPYSGAKPITGNVTIIR